MTTEHVSYSKRIVALAIAGLVLAGCEVGPDYRRPAFPVPPRYSEGFEPRRTAQVATTGGRAQDLTVGHDVAADWWALFRSPALTDLVVTALRDNPGVDAAKEAIRNADELTLAQYSGLLPAVSGTFARTYDQLPLAEDGVTPGSPGGGTISAHFYTAELSPISYNLDVWGGIRRGIEQRRALAAYERSTLEATDLTLTANVVSTAVTIASLERQIQLEQGLVGYSRRYLATLQVQFQTGAVNGTDVALQQTQVAQYEALIPPLRTTLEQDRHLLAAYLGRTPADAALPRLDLDALSLPPELPLSLPASLLDHRPDVRQAEANLHASTAAIGVAVANRLPQLSIQASLGSAAVGAQDLFTGGGGLSSFILQAVQPIFQGGLLLHQQRAAEATARQDAALWRQTAIGAYQQVADVLSAIRNDSDELTEDLAAAQAAKHALALAEMQYRLGGVALLTVLTAEVNYQNSSIALVRAQAARFTDSAALFTALGGGWWNRNDIPPPPPGVFPSLLPWSAS